jgi:hypothetical protein
MGSHEPFGHLQHKLWQKKGQESNWQFNSRPLKVRNRPNPGVRRWSVTHHWKALDESYKFALDLIQIGGPNKNLWLHKVAGVQIGTISRLLLGSLGIKNHLDASAMQRCREYYMGEGGGFPESGPWWWVLWVQSCSWLVSKKWTNQLVGWFDASSSK